MSKIALITDGTEELGQAICAKLASLGYQVVTTYSSNNERIDQLNAALERQSGKIHAYPCNTADENSILQCLREIEQADGPVDILINSIGLHCDKTFADTEKQSLDTGIYLCSFANMAKSVLDGMVHRGWGRVVNIFSVYAQKEIYDQVDFSAARTGLQELTRSLSLESRNKGITVNMIVADLMRQKRLAAAPEEASDNAIASEKPARLSKAEEVASLAAYLVSEEAAFLSGKTISVKGWLARNTSIEAAYLQTKQGLESCPVFSRKIAE